MTAPTPAQIAAFREAQSICEGIAEESRISYHGILFAVALDLTAEERLILRRLLQLARQRREGG